MIVYVGVQIWTFDPSAVNAEGIITSAASVASAGVKTDANLDTVFTQRTCITRACSSLPSFRDVKQYAGMALVSDLPHSVRGCSLLNVAYNLAFSDSLMQYVTCSLDMARAYRAADPGVRKARSNKPHYAVFSSMLYNYFVKTPVVHKQVRDAVEVLYMYNENENQVDTACYRDVVIGPCTSLSCQDCGAPQYATTYFLPKSLSVRDVLLCAQCCMQRMSTSTRKRKPSDDINLYPRIVELVSERYVRDKLQL
jgi:hypothetical protein